MCFKTTLSVTASAGTCAGNNLPTPERSAALGQACVLDPQVEERRLGERYLPD